MDFNWASSTFSNVNILIDEMGSSTINFVGDVVTNLWPLFLSLGVLAFAGAFILRKTGIGRR